MSKKLLQSRLLPRINVQVSHYYYYYYYCYCDYLTHNVFEPFVVQVSAYGFMTPNYIDFSDHYYDKTYHKVGFYANHDFRLEMCGPHVPGLTGEGVCPILSLPCPEAPATMTTADATSSSTSSSTTSAGPDLPSPFCQRGLLELGAGACNDGALGLLPCGLPCPLSTSAATLPGVNPVDLSPPGPSGPHHHRHQHHPAQTECSSASSAGPPPTSGIPERGAASVGDGRAAEDVGLPEPASLPPGLDLTREEGEEAEAVMEVAYGQRSSVEREVAQHLATGFWPDAAADQGGMAEAADFHWLKQLDLTSSTRDCPFLRDLGSAGDGEGPEIGVGIEVGAGAGADPGVGADPGADADPDLSLSERSPYMSSSLNSAEESDMDTDDDDKGGEVVAEVRGVVWCDVTPGH